MTPIVIRRQTDVVGCFLVCSSSRGIHVVASYIFVSSNNDSDIFNVGGKFLRWPFMCLADILVL